MIERGELWWVDLGEPQGAAPGFRRPVLVVSADSYNRSRISTFLGIVVTSNLRLAEAPGNVLLEKGTGGLPEDSVANVSQIVTLDKSDAIERIGRLDTGELRLVNAGIRQALGLLD